jgi:hypothetical protein
VERQPPGREVFYVESLPDPVISPVDYDKVFTTGKAVGALRDDADDAVAVPILSEVKIQNDPCGYSSGFLCWIVVRVIINVSSSVPCL